MSNEEAYKKWLRDGGDGVDLAVTRQALKFQSASHYYLTLSALSQAVVAQHRRIAQLEERIDALTAR